MKVICTEKSQILASRLDEALNVPLVDVKFSRFPDGELYLLAAGDLMTRPLSSAVLWIMIHWSSCC